MTINNNSKEIVFIFSLPRSGSTLLQRILMTSSDITSANEPWILLWLTSIFRKDLSESKYNHSSLINAIHDNNTNYAKDKLFLKNNIKDFANRYYQNLTEDSNAKYFVDKTPNYILIINEIFELFQDSKFIFLSRNPLAVAASISKAWTKNKIQFSQYHYLFNEGVESFSENYTKNKDRVLLIKYENLVKNPNDQIKKINQYLNLQNKINTNNLNTSNLRGTMGDSFLPSTFDKDMINDNKNWINFYDSIYRKIWAKRFLKKIGQKNLEIMGYNESELFKQIKSKKTLKIISFKDIIGYLQYRLYEIVRKIRFREFGFREVF